MQALLTRIVIVLLNYGHISAQEFSMEFPHGVSDCHPLPNPTKTQYLIGYGSLINSESKNKTYPYTGNNIPVEIDGFRRSWTAKGINNVSLSTTFLGVDIDAHSSLNGVMFSVPKAEGIAKYDNREMGYCRVNVPLNQVNIIRGNISDNGTFPSDAQLQNSQFWVYVTSPTFREFPDNEYPIVQSYVDIFLGGCINIENKYGLNEFAKKCITTTDGWNSPWVNDRLYPRRPFMYSKNSWSIDKLIKSYIPGHTTYIEKFFVSRSFITHSVSTRNELNLLIVSLFVITANMLKGFSIIFP